MEHQGFSVGAQVNQTDQEIEHIARAFFVARNENGAWESASRIIKHEFRLYARLAIGMLKKNQEQTWADGVEMAPFQSYEAA